MGARQQTAALELHKLASQSDRLTAFLRITPRVIPPGAASNQAVPGRSPTALVPSSCCPETRPSLVGIELVTQDSSVTK
jgi:hypothetical protein